MARFDECSVGDTCKVTDLRSGTIYHGTIIRLVPDETGGPGSKVDVQYDGHTTFARVDPGFVTLDVGENDVEDFLR